jgi:hypothetical protein
MPSVSSVEAKGDKAAILVMDDGSRIWTPEKEKADPLVGKPIPSDWTRKEGDYGPQAFPPRVQKFGGGGGAAAFRNTKEGQAIEQERMDRRTALMQAVALVNAEPEEVREEWKPVAEEFYEWLRETSGEGPMATTAKVKRSTSVPLPSTSSTVVGQHSGEKPASGRAEQAGGGGPTSEGVAVVPGEEAVAAPSDDPCTHPVDARRETASGRIRCGVCRYFID